MEIHLIDRATNLALPLQLNESPLIMAHISPSDFTNRQDSATVQRTVQKSKIWGGSEFETEDGRSEVGILDYHVKSPNTFIIFFIY